MSHSEILLDELLEALGPEEPACLYTIQDGHISIVKQSPYFTDSHATSLFSSPKSEASDRLCNSWTSLLPGPVATELEWKITNLRGGTHRLARGRSLAQTTIEDKTGVADRYLASWSRFTVPGLSQDVYDKHLALIANLDWSKTDLGPMDSWSTSLLSYVGSTLAASHPVLLAWGPTHVLIYNVSEKPLQ